MDHRALLALGQFRKKERLDLREIAQEASLELELIDDSRDAASFLRSHTPAAMLVSDAAEGAGQVCLQARATSNQAQLPIISLSRELDDLSFADVFSWGGDDAVNLTEVRPLLSRVRSLPREAQEPADVSRGGAVVADPDRDRRVVRARVLRNAGYSVDFAITAQEALGFAARDSTTLIVVDEELEGADVALAENARRHPETMHILLCAPRHLAEHSRQLGVLANAAATDGFAPPENVVFLANELSRGGGNDKRASRRLLYGTKVAFRGEGRDADDFGFSYNISEGGLYVRTLAPPTDDRVWLELRPPRTDRRVRLEGEVVWRRPFGPAHSATVPPGFGVRITEATASNMKTWASGYEQFLLSLGHSRESLLAV